jgi:hypothetical protein
MAAVRGAGPAEEEGNCCVGEVVAVVACPNPWQILAREVLIFIDDLGIDSCELLEDILHPVMAS